MGDRLAGSGTIAIRGPNRRDEGRRFHQHPSIQEAPSRLDYAGRADRMAWRAVRVT